jgi:hypothetical protein
MKSTPGETITRSKPIASPRERRTCFLSASIAIAVSRTTRTPRASSPE